MLDAQEVLRRITTESGPVGLVMDFDGVLSEITDDPASSCLVDGAANADFLGQV